MKRTEDCIWRQLCLLSDIQDLAPQQDIRFLGRWAVTGTDMVFQALVVVNRC